MDNQLQSLSKAMLSIIVKILKFANNVYFNKLKQIQNYLFNIINVTRIPRGFLDCKWRKYISTSTSKPDSQKKMPCIVNVHYKIKHI